MIDVRFDRYVTVNRVVEVDRWAPPRKYVDTGCVPTDKSACLSIWSAC